jgi:hypothetical protein
MKKILSSLAASAAFALLIGFVPASAFADDADVSAVASALTNSQRHAENETAKVLSNVATVKPSADGRDVLKTSQGGVALSIPRDPSNPLTVESSSGTRFSIKLPFSKDAKAARPVGDGIVAFDNQNSSSTAPILKTDGSLQIASVIMNEAAPTSYAYQLSLPQNFSKSEGQDGSVLFLKDNGALIAGVAPAWALDATGKKVPTHFEVQGSTLVQVVDHRAAGYSYPIVADPWLFVDLISSFKWVASSQGSTISVAVTPMMAIVDSPVAAVAGWAELYDKVGRTGSSNLARLSGASMQQQWDCHAAGKVLIGIAGWLGIDKRPTWDLETWRPVISNPLTAIASHCNWN